MLYNRLLEVKNLTKKKKKKKKKKNRKFKSYRGLKVRQIMLSLLTSVFIAYYGEHEVNIVKIMLV